MNVLDAISNRYSVRQYRPEPVAPELLERLVEAAHQAPSSRNLQPWEFIIVTDPDLKKALRAAANDQAHVEEAGALFICLGSLRQQDALAERLQSLLTDDTTPERRERLQKTVTRMRSDEEFRKTHVLTNTYIGISFLVLAAQSMGLSSVWMGGFDAEKVKQILSIPEDYLVASLVSVGYPAETAIQPPRKRRPVPEITHWNRFGSR